MKRVAVTSHAVDRYRGRVEGAEGFSEESIRQIIRDIVFKGFDMGMVRPHPSERDRRIIPFQSGGSVLYLSIGPNTTNYPADIAVIGVLYEREVTNGKMEMGVKLGDILPGLKDIKAAPKTAPRYAIFIGAEKTIEHYRAKDVAELRTIINNRRPRPDEVAIYQLIE